MSVVDVAAVIGSVALAATRLLTAAAPFWKKLPPVVAAFVPAVVAMLPQLADSMGLVHTEIDLVQNIIVAAALLMPGAAAAVHKDA